MRGVAVIAVIVACTAVARAEPPRLPHVIDAPTAWLVPRGEAWGHAGASHRGDLAITVGAGLAGIAEVAVGAVDKRGMARFTVGAPVGLARVALGFETTIRGAAQRHARLHLVASLARAGVRGHAGAALTDAADATRHLRRGFGQVRPLAGVEYTPRMYPQTTLLGDVIWAPSFDADRIRLGWSGAWGVRYQALTWGAIELTVRHREGDDLSGATVLVKVTGVTW